MKEFLDKWGIRTIPYIKYIPIIYLIFYVSYATYGIVTINSHIEFLQYYFTMKSWKTMELIGILTHDSIIFCFIYFFYKYFTKRPRLCFGFLILFLLLKSICYVFFGNFIFVKNYFSMIEQARLTSTIAESVILRLISGTFLPIIFAIPACKLIYKILIKNRTIPKLRAQLTLFIMRDMARLVLLIYANFLLYSNSHHNLDYYLKDFYFEYLDIGFFITTICYIFGLPYICLFKTFAPVECYKCS